jgi:hypothetical protein
MSLNRTIEQIRALHAVWDAVTSLPLRELTAAMETERSARALGAISVFSPFEREVLGALVNAVRSVEPSRAREEGMPAAQPAAARRSARRRYSR